MTDLPKYVTYRNKRIPSWWEIFLPNEQNPYKSGDTLTLLPGCLSDYWHIHSSNKHYNPKGAEACNAVQRMVYERFGGAFLTSPFRTGYGGHRGQTIYNEPMHLVYENAYLSDERIHIKNASDFFPYETDAQIEKVHQEHQMREEKSVLRNSKG